MISIDACEWATIFDRYYWCDFLFCFNFLSFRFNKSCINYDLDLSWYSSTFANPNKPPPGDDLQRFYESFVAKRLFFYFSDPICASVFLIFDFATMFLRSKVGLCPRVPTTSIYGALTCNTLTHIDLAASFLFFLISVKFDCDSFVWCPSTLFLDSFIIFYSCD